MSASVGAGGEAWEATVLAARQADAEQYATEWKARVVEYDGLVGIDGPVAHGRTRHDAVCMALMLYLDASSPSAPPRASARGGHHVRRAEERGWRP